MTPGRTPDTVASAPCRKCDALVLAEQVLDREVVGPARRAYLAPRALRRILVRTEAEQARAVAEAVLLELVEAHLDDELRLQRRLLELAAAPAVRLAEAAVVLLVHERQTLAAISAWFFAPTAAEPT